MIGDRIRQARLAEGLTLEELAKSLGSGVITKAGLSKYELNKSVPDSDLLTQIAKVLKVKASYFLKESECAVEWVAYRKRASLTKTRQEEVKAKALKWVEGYCALKDMIYPDLKIPKPQRAKVKSFEDVEKAASDLREEWGLGRGPIKSLTQLIEDRYGIVVFLDSDENFDGLSGWANEQIPVVITKRLIFDDRIRLNLAHELGHLALDCPENDPKKEEQFAYRFAAAFLVPQEKALVELGKSRHSLSFDELGLLKQKYGMSMQAWIRRAFDLGIISSSYYRILNIDFRKRGFHRKEPFEFNGQETIQKFSLMVMRALKEEIISMDWVHNHCPKEIAEMTEVNQIQERSDAIFKLLELPVEQRRAVLRQAAVDLKDEYNNNKDLTAFTDSNNEEFHGDSETR